MQVAAPDAFALVPRAVNPAVVIDYSIAMTQKLLTTYNDTEAKLSPWFGEVKTRSIKASWMPLLDILINAATLRSATHNVNDNYEGITSARVFKGASTIVTAPVKEDQSDMQIAICLLTSLTGNHHASITSSGTRGIPVPGVNAPNLSGLTSPI